MILLSLRCTKGVYPCWETLGIKKPLIWRHYNKERSFFHKTSNYRQATHQFWLSVIYFFASACGSYIMYSSPPPKQRTHRMNNMYLLGWCRVLLCSWGRWAQNQEEDLDWVEMLDYLSLKYSWKLDTWLLKSMKQRMILKVQKVLKLLKEHKLRLLCCQRMVRSFVKTIYSESVFHMILLSLRCTKGVYPCWETLGVKKHLLVKNLVIP